MRGWRDGGGTRGVGELAVWFGWRSGSGVVEAKLKEGMSSSEGERGVGAGESKNG